jgi:hypothetical protein
VRKAPASAHEEPHPALAVRTDIERGPVTSERSLETDPVTEPERSALLGARLVPHPFSHEAVDIPARDARDGVLVSATTRPGARRAGPHGDVLGPRRLGPGGSAWVRGVFTAPDGVARNSSGEHGRDKSRGAVRCHVTDTAGGRREVRRVVRPAPHPQRGAGGYPGTPSVAGTGGQGDPQPRPTLVTPRYLAAKKTTIFSGDASFGVVVRFWGGCMAALPAI